LNLPRALLLLVFLLGLLLPKPAAASFSRPLPALHPPPAQSTLIAVPNDEWPRAVLSLNLCDLPRPPPYRLFANGDPFSLADPFGLGAQDKAGIIEQHHITPKYLGGDPRPNGSA